MLNIRYNVAENTVASNIKESLVTQQLLSVKIVCISAFQLICCYAKYQHINGFSKLTWNS